MNSARRFDAGKGSTEIACVVSATPESVGCSAVANATGDADSFSYPALKPGLNSHRRYPSKALGVVRNRVSPAP
jgi:hypothetical protein